MQQLIANPMVKVDQNNGQVVISSSDFTSNPVVKELINNLFSKKVRGRMYITKEDDLVFEQYQSGVSTSIVQVKEQVGQISAVRSAKSVKFSLSLPATMSKNQMILAVLEQYGNLVDALREGGLYERLVNLQQTAEQDVAEVTAKAA